MDIASDVVELFLTRDPVRARELAIKLDALNQARRDSEAKALEAIEDELLTLLDADGAYPADCIILDHPEWHRGVLGILASRVVDRTGRPALVLTHADGDAHGSGRSIPGFHLLDAITAAHAVTNPGAPCLDSETWEGPPQPPAEPTTLFHRFGGHAHAVGFSLPSNRLPDLRARLSAHSTALLTAPLLTPPVEYDAELSLSDITPEFFAWIARLAPFGIGNPEPIFFTRNAILAAPVRAIKEKHVCLQLTQTGPNERPGSPVLSALGWSRANPSSWAARCALLGLNQGSAVDLLYRLKRNTGPYANTTCAGLELELCELRPAEN
jgi:single-stranded-DNA-specific exonuclease